MTATQSSLYAELIGHYVQLQSTLAGRAFNQICLFLGKAG